MTRPSRHGSSSLSSTPSITHTVWTVLALLLALLLLSPHASRAQSIISVDMGVDFFEVVLVSPGRSFDIAMSPDSKRKSWAGISVLDGTRGYGSEAVNTYGKKPSHVAWRVRDLVGRSMDHAPSLLKKLKTELIAYEVVKPTAEEGGGIKIKLATGTKDERVLPSEEVLAMMLIHARDMGEQHGGANVKVNSVVLTVPSYFTHAQRQGLLDACEIAGLTVLGLIDENTAAIVQFAQERTFNSTERILVFNQGSGSTQVSVFEVSGGKDKKTGKDYRNIRTLSKAWNATLGALELDMALVDYFASDFTAKFPKCTPPIHDSMRAMVRLKKEARQVKEVLSGLERYPVSFQQLHNDIDYKGEVTRAKLEELTKGFVASIEAPIRRALEGAGLTPKDLTAVEVVGGGIRVPSVRNEVRRVLTPPPPSEGEGATPEVELSTHINGDEGMAFGGAFYGANVSKAFRVPRIVMLQDCLSREVRLRLVKTNEDGTDRVVSLFPRFSAMEAKDPRLTTIKFRVARDFELKLSEVKAPGDDEETMMEEEVVVGTYDVEGFEDANLKNMSERFGEPKVSLTFALDRNAMVGLTFAEARFDEEYEEIVQTNRTDPENPEKNLTETVKKQRKHRLPLRFKYSERDMNVRRMTSEAKKEAIARLVAWDASDRNRARLAAARNDLEAFSFTARDKISTHEADIRTVLKPEALESLLADLAAVDDFISDAKSVQDPSYFETKRQELSGRVQAAFKAFNEVKERPTATAAMRDFLEAVEQRKANWTVERPWVPAARIEAVLEAVKTARAWLEEKKAAQAQLTNFDEPALTVGAIKVEMEKIQKLVEGVLRIRKPVPPVEKPRKAASSEANETSEANTTTEASEAASKEGENPDAGGADSTTAETQTATNEGESAGTKEEL